MEYFRLDTDYQQLCQRLIICFGSYDEDETQARGVVTTESRELADPIVYFKVVLNLCMFFVGYLDYYLHDIVNLRSHGHRFRS